MKMLKILSLFLKTNSQKLLAKSFMLIAFLSLFSCVKPYEVDVYTSKGYLLVDGTITNLPEQQYISIARTDPDVKYTSSAFTSSINPPTKAALPLVRATVSVLVNNTQSIKLTEIEPGIYALPDNFRAKVGDSYQLKIIAPDGTKYESPDEKMLPVSAIKNVTENFNAKGIKKLSIFGEYTPTNDLSVDFDDPAGEKNFYRWRWFDYETVKYCETCRRGRYNQYEDEFGINGACFQDLTLATNDIFDYTCESVCWDIYPSPDILIFSDIYTNGQPQASKLVAQVPLYQSNPCLVSIQQLSISANAYRYYKLIQDQSVATGTLADTPPAPIKSNVINVNDSAELVLGYFTASAVAESRTMVDRKNTKGALFNGLFKFLNNRLPNPESVSFDRGRIPLALCKPNRNRINTYPYGWK